MSYGIEIRNNDTNLVLDENNPVVVVSEKGTRGNNTVTSITSVNDDTGGWYKLVDEDVYFTTIVLTNSYTTPPLLAIRNAGGGYGSPVPKAAMYISGGTSYNRIRMYSTSPKSVDWIVCSSSSDLTPTIDATQNYGFEIKDTSNSKVFDSRWVDVVSLVDVVSMPNNGLTVTGAGTSSVSTVPVSSTITVPDSSGCFYVTGGLSGMKEVREYKDTEPGLEFYYGGGKFIPSISPLTSTTVGLAGLKIGRGEWTTNAASGQIVDGTAEFGGSIFILRYLNF